MSEPIFTKVEVEHSAGCFSVGSVVRGDRDHPWSGCLDEDRPNAWMRRDGRAGTGSTHFWRMVCNDPDCPARLLIRANDILALLTEAAHV